MFLANLHAAPWGGLRRSGLTIVDGSTNLILFNGPNTAAWLFFDPFWTDGVQLGGSWNQPRAEGTDLNHKLSEQIMDITGEWVKVDDTNSAVAYSAGWTQCACNPSYHNTEHWSVSSNALATFTFTSTQARFYGYRRWDLGFADIYVDGLLKASVDCYAPVACFNQLLYEVNGLNPGSHTLQVRVAGRKNPSSSGIQVLCDAFSSGTPPPYGINDIKKAWWDNYFSEADFAMMAQLGFNSARIPFDCRLFGTLVTKTNGYQVLQVDTNAVGFQYLDKAVSWCQKYHLYAIPDLHIVPSGMVDDADSLSSTAALWQAIASRYQTNVWVGAYDLWNEPNWAHGNYGLNGGKNPTIVYVCQQLVNAIRQVDTNHLIFLEGCEWADRLDCFFYNPVTKQLTNALQVSDTVSNLAFSFHRYGGTIPDVYNPAQDLGPDGSDYSGSSSNYLWTIPHQKKLAAMANLPLWCGEAGYNVCDFMRTQVQVSRSTTNSADFGVGAGLALWCYKRSGDWGVVYEPWPNSGQGFDNVNQYWSQLNTYWNAPTNALPVFGFTPAQASTWLYQFACSFNASNCTVNPDFPDLLIHSDGVARPYGSGATIPGRIFAVNYDLGGEGVAYHDTATGNNPYRLNAVDIASCPDVGLGYKIGSIASNEWTSYTVAATPGIYDLNLRYSGYSGTLLRVSLNGTSLTATNILLPTQGGWDSYGTYTLRNVAVTASGNATLRLDFVSPNFDLNWIEFEATNAVTPLSGTIIGTAGSFNNNGNDRTKAFDGNFNTYFDAPTNNGAWVGLDLGAGVTQAVCRVRYCPRSGYESRMAGGKIQGATVADFSSGVADLFSISSAPLADMMTEQNFYNTNTYRYVRYLSPASSYGNIAELEFHGRSLILLPAPPSAPVGLTATAGAGQVSLNWNAVSSANSYNVKRATATGGPYTNVTSLAATNYTDSGLLNGTNYFYVVSAVNPGGEGTNSLQVSATPLSPPAFVLVANTVTNTLILTWPAFYNGSHLLIQSNPPSQGLGMIWTDTGPVTNSVVMPLTKGSGSMFFQLRTP